jgi:hypothetical protein
MPGIFFLIFPDKKYRECFGSDKHSQLTFQSGRPVMNEKDHIPHLGLLSRNLKKFSLRGTVFFRGALPRI